MYCRLAIVSLSSGPVSASPNLGTSQSADQRFVDDPCPQIKTTEIVVRGSIPITGSLPPVWRLLVHESDIMFCYCAIAGCWMWMAMLMTAAALAARKIVITGSLWHGPYRFLSIFCTTASLVRVFPIRHAKITAYKPMNISAVGFPRRSESPIRADSVSQSALTGARGAVASMSVRAGLAAPRSWRAVL